jgi:hypothetical protein
MATGASGSAGTPAQGKEMTSTGGVHLSAGGGDGADTLSGRRDSGPGPTTGPDRFGPPGLSSFFFCSLIFFLFLVFSFLFYLLQF